MSHNNLKFIQRETCRARRLVAWCPFWVILARRLPVAVWLQLATGIRLDKRENVLNHYPHDGSIRDQVDMQSIGY
jgi:hypothetical protein